MAVAERIAEVNGQGRAALIIYLPAGFPDMDGSQACIEAAVEGGADLIEVGLPYSDPLMDGPIIQAANQVAMSHGYTPADDLQMCGRLTDVIDVPAVAMTYYNIAWHFGGVDQLEAFATACSEAGLAGTILPDLPADEGVLWQEVAAAHGLQTVFLTSPSSTDERIRGVVDASTGFIYATSTMGVTGVRQSLSERARPLVERIRPMTDKPVCVGIGVTLPEHAEEVAGFADGVIVGSAVVEAAGSGGPKAVKSYVAGLAEGVRRAERTG